MKCNFVHSAGLRLRNDIMFIQQDLFYGMLFEWHLIHLIHSARLS